MDNISEELKGILDEFKTLFGYELEEMNEDLEYVIFERSVERNHTHRLILEDHTWEKTWKNYNPKTDIGDWLIFSELTDMDRDWFGHFVDTQYPLTYTEYKTIEKIIKILEKERKEIEL